MDKKSNEKQTKQRAHKATDVEIKYKSKSSFATLGSIPFVLTFEQNDGGFRHSQWRDHFRQLCEYKVQFGHCIVPQQYSANPKLGQWVSKQRTRYRKNTEEKSTSMTAEHIRALDGIGFDWGTSKTDLASIWNVRFQQLCEFKVQFGHYLVPIKYSANPQLGQWVSKQRCNYRLYQEGKPSRITEERIRELESVGFEWETTAAFWSLRVRQMREFKVQFGHCLVPIKYSANPKLGKWVSKQRYHCKLYQEGKPSPMTAKRIQDLESVEFEWETTVAFWSLRFRELREFKAQFGHCLVPNKYSANPTLGQWVSTQRSNYRIYQEGKPSPMTAERIQELEIVEFEWEPNCVSWNERFEQLRKFRAQFGHCVVPIRYSANLKLGKWVSTQRSTYRLYKEGKPSPMTAERIRELERVEFKWSEILFL